MSEENELPDVSLEQEFQEVTSESSSQTTSSNLPDKFKGKSLEEIVDSYVNLEKEYGRQSQEIGQYRKLADKFIQDGEPVKQKTERKESKFDTEEFIKDPHKTLDSFIESHPVIQDTIDKAEKEVRELKMRLLNEKHPDYMDLIKSQDFVNWVMAEPSRQMLFKEADNYNITAADELFTSFKNQKNEASATVDKVNANREAALKDAASESGGTAGGKKKKVYRRSDIINLKISDPDKYVAMQDEIMAAYAEGRVK